MANYFCMLKKEHTGCAHCRFSPSCPCLAAEWITSEIYPVCSEIVYAVIFIILDSSKKKKSETKLTTQNGKKKCWYNDSVNDKKKNKTRNLSSIQWEVWTASAEQQNAINVTYNDHVHWFHNIKNHGWSVIGLPVCVCLYAHTHNGKRMCVGGWVCYWGNASSFISMRGLSWLSMRRLGPIMSMGANRRLHVSRWMLN